MLGTYVRAQSLPQLRDLYKPVIESRYRREAHRDQFTREHKNVLSAINRFVKYAPRLKTRKAPDRGGISAAVLNAWVDQMSMEDLTLDYINASLGRVRRWLHWGVERKHVHPMVMDELRQVKARRSGGRPARAPGTWTPPTMEQIEKAVPFLPRTARMVHQLERLTGARPSELLEAFNAEVHNDDLGARIVPRQHKCAHRRNSPAATRIIPLCPEALAIVEQLWKPTLPNQRLFYSAKCKHEHYTLKAYRDALERACRRAGIDRIKPYDIRHRVGRQVRSTCGLDAAQALLGHTKATTTEIYAPLAPECAETFKAARRAARSLQQVKGQMALFDPEDR